MSVVKQYTKELHKKFGYYATWLPGKRIKIGDVGVLYKNVFERETSLKNLGIDFKVIKDKTKMDLDYRSEGSVNISPKISGQAPVAGSKLANIDAGITVEFTKSKSIAFQASGVLLHQIEDLMPVKKEVFKLYATKEWEKNWVIVTELAVADSATILISSASSTTIDIKAKSDIGMEQLKIANADAGLHLMNSMGLETKIMAESELNPLFKVVGIKSKKIVTKGEDGTDAQAFGEIDFED